MPITAFYWHLFHIESIQSKLQVGTDKPMVRKAAIKTKGGPSAMKVLHSNGPSAMSADG